MIHYEKVHVGLAICLLVQQLCRNRFQTVKKTQDIMTAGSTSALSVERASAGRRPLELILPAQY